MTRMFPLASRAVEFRRRTYHKVAEARSQQMYRRRHARRKTSDSYHVLHYSSPPPRSRRPPCSRLALAMLGIGGSHPLKVSEHACGYTPRCSCGDGRHNLPYSVSSTCFHSACGRRADLCSALASLASGLADVESRRFTVRATSAALSTTSTSTIASLQVFQTQ